MLNKKILLLLLSLAAFCPFCSMATVQVLPQPVVVNVHSGTFVCPDVVSISASGGLDNEVAFLKEYLQTDYSWSASEGRQHQGDILLQLDETFHPGQREAYQLEVLPQQVRIKANAAPGIFYGIQTLRQVLKKVDGRLVAEQLRIEDYPRFAWRAFMLDEARHFKGKEVVRHLLDEMAALKMNVFHWHLTNDQGWRIEIKKYPRLTEVGAYRDSTEINHFNSNVFDGKPHGGYYTQDDMREIVAYARARHIEVIPEITLPGHLTAACAAYPWLGTTGQAVKVSPKFGVHYQALNVADPKVYQFLSDVFDEVLSVFPSPVIHIGGDELRYNQWNESAEIQQYMQAHQLKGGAELQVYFTNRLSKMLAEKGRRMIGWNEITGDKLHDYQTTEDQKEQENQENQLAPGTIVQFWKGDPDLMKKSIDRGFDIVNSYHAMTYLDYDYKSISLKKAYKFNPIPQGITPEQEKQVLGIGCQMWGEFIPTVQRMNHQVYPRIAAYAEVGWTQAEQKNYPQFIQRLQYFLDKWKAEGIVYGPVK